MQITKNILSCLLILSSLQLPAQPWTKGERDYASTASEINGLSEEEKNVFMYLNLARMYPKRFAQNELRPYLNFKRLSWGEDRYSNPKELNSYESSLKKTLLEMKPVPPLKFNRELYELARCFSEEMKKFGIIGHERKNCRYDYMAECCSYGPTSGRNHILNLLVDDGVEDLGHRVICLMPNLINMGASINGHKEYGTSCVLDFN